MTPRDPIDAVITWVDGTTPRHRANRLHHMAQSSTPLHENAANPHRWLNNDEILYCLQSIANHAPWTRKIWVVVDEDAPDLSTLPPALRAKIHIAHHADIFAGFTDHLPTFNSLAIETMLWRIDGLAERFMYFNDDVFITAPLQPHDMFHGQTPVLRGEWVDYSALLHTPDARADPALFNHFMQINAAKIAGYTPHHLFAAAHVVHPFLRTRMADLFERHRATFLNNITHRFRDLSQFLPQGLHNHASLHAGDAIISAADDHLHITSGQGNGRPANETQTLLERATDPDIKFLCINDLPQLEALIPQTRDWITRAIGGPPRPQTATAHSHADPKHQRAGCQPI
jgi:hypothetical protein